MSIQIKRSHNLSPEVARARVDTVAQDLRTRMAMTCHWESDRLVFTRSGANGSIRLGDKEIEVIVELGLLLRGMESGIRSTIEERIDQALAG